MSTRPKQQKSIKRDRRYHASECSEKTDLQEKKITHDAPIAVKDETQQCQEYKIQTPFIPERHIFPTEKQYSLYPNMINPLPRPRTFQIHFLQHQSMHPMNLHENKLVRRVVRTYHLRRDYH